MRKLPDSAAAATGPDIEDDEGSADVTLPHIPRIDASDPPRARSRVVRSSHGDEERLEELELRLREWVERVDTLESELRYVQRDLEVRIAYTRELERQLDQQVNTARRAESEAAAIRARTAYRVVDVVVARVATRPALYGFGVRWARRMISWRER
jgi:hypothetical protein